jgi:hypothetical protein
MKKYIFFLLILFVYKTVAQNKQLLYNFAELPQASLLNPATKTNYKFHIGIPLLSGISSELGATGFVLTDLFAEDNRNINEKITSALSKLESEDLAILNTQIEVLSGGYRINDKLYLSFGFYEEIDAFGNFPVDFLTLITEGNNTALNRSFSASQFNYKLDVLGVLHVGVSKEISKNLTVGGRFKIYSSALNTESTNNTGTLTTVEGTNNLYTHYFNNMNLSAKSSGLVDSETNEYIEDVGSYLGNTFFGPNMGIGLDFGITYNFSPQLEFSGSILDFGFINHKNNIKNTTVKGNFDFEGVDFLFDADNSSNFWDQINNRFKRDMPTTEDQESYISWRPVKLNLALKYSFGERRSRVCYDNRYKDFFTDAIGVQLFTAFRPAHKQMAITAFYEKSLTQKLHTKFTYTIDDFSYTNIGAGLSAQLGNLNVYTMLDNILSYENLSSANHVSLQLGFNLIFN